MSNLRIQSRFTRGVPVMLVAALAFAGLAAPAHAVTSVEVDTETEILAALAGTAELIQVTGDITLSGETQLPITRPLTIEGSKNPDGTPGKTIDGEDLVRIFEVASDGVVLRDLIVTNGNGEDSNGTGVDEGGAIRNTGGNLTLDNVIVSSSTAANGGGIYNASGSTLTILGSTITGNSAGTNLGLPERAWGNGGGISSAGGTVTIESSTIGGSSLNDANVAGSGGAIYVDGGTVNLTSSTVSYNSTANSGNGAGFYTAGTAALTVTNSTLYGNSANRDGSGGAFYHASTGLLSVEFSTVTNNWANSGAGIYLLTGTEAPRSATVTNSIIAINQANMSPDFEYGNGLFSQIFLTSVNTIWGQTTVANVEYPAVTKTQLFEIATTQNNVPLFDFHPTTDVPNPKTKSVKLQTATTNPAIDQVTLVEGDPTVDQRGVARSQGTKADIGAFEAMPVSSGSEEEVTETPAQDPVPDSTTGLTPSAPATERLGGADRYETSVSISQELFPTAGVPVVYVATGATYPDALAASAAATGEGGPVLLVRQDSVPASVQAEIIRLQPSRIVVMGGTAVISSGVENELRSYGTVTRVGGSDRYETAVQTAQDFTATGESVFLVTGANHADATSSGSLFGSYPGPVLLVNPGNGLSPQVEAEITRLAPARVFVVGGTAAVSVQAENDAKALGYEVIRLAGTDRYATSVAVADWGRSNGGYGTLAIAATGQDFPDGLTSGVLAGHRNAPVLLNNGVCWTPDAKTLIGQLAPSTIKVIGGVRALGDSVGNLATCS